MIENEMAKLENPDQVRMSSCLYPSLARCFSSSVSLSISAMKPSGRDGMRSFGG